LPGFYALQNLQRSARRKVGRKLGVVFLCRHDRGMPEHGLNDVHLGAVFTQRDAVMTPEILQEKALQARRLDGPVDSLPAALSAPAFSRVAKNVGTSGKRRHLIDPALAFVRHRHDAELPGLGVVGKDHAPFGTENLSVLECHGFIQPVSRLPYEPNIGRIRGSAQARK
jgi:hypothetical protein